MLTISDRRPWLTVVTVHKDDIAGLRRTLTSIACQRLEGVQHLIIDSSSDPLATFACTRDYAALSSTIHCTLPEGIYPAMNCGVAEAGGLYVMFTNAGDCLADQEVLTNIHDIVIDHSPRWMFGSLTTTNSSGVSAAGHSWSYSRQKAKRFRNGRFPQQPAMVVQTELLRSVGGFESRFSIAADYRTMLALAQAADPWRLDFAVSHFELGGASTVHWWRSLWEAYRARCVQFETGRLASMLEFVKSVPVFVRAAAARILGLV